LKSSERFDAQPYFSVPLSPLSRASRVSESSAAGTGDLDGILIPSSEIDRARVGVTSQFLEDADQYHQKYSASPYFKHLLERAIERCGLKLDSPVILDIGSGSGNSIFPCLEIFESPRIVATDISPDLLRVLALHVQKIGREAQVVPVCMDVTRDLYREASFDLVVGAAILHHLVDPEAAILAALRALKPGRHAIFFEPFEAGHAILRLAYKEILERGRGRGPLEDAALRVLEAKVADVEIRSGADKSHPIYTEIDDKWLFTRHYIEDIAARLKVSDLVISPLHVTATPFSDETRTHLHLSAGLPPEALGSWAWDILNDYDSAFSPDLRTDLMIAGTIVLTK
jgi:SAM-dependent methyltransferase